MKPIETLCPIFLLCMLPMHATEHRANLSYSQPYIRILPEFEIREQSSFERAP